MSLNVIHLIRYELKSASRVQSQIFIDDGEVLENTKFIDIRRIILIGRQKPEQSVLIFHQHSMILNALVTKLLYGERYQIVFDVHDRLREFQSQAGIKRKILALLLRCLELLLCRSKCRLLTVSQGLAEIYKQKYGSKPHVFYSIPQPNKIKNFNEYVCRSLICPQIFKLVYFGTLSHIRFPQKYVEKLFLRGYTIDVYGKITGDLDFKKKFEKYCDQGCVRYLGPYEGNNIMHVLPKYHALLMAFDSQDPNILNCMPNKLFQAFQSDLICIVSDNLKEVLDTFSSSGCLITIDDFLNKKNIVMVRSPKIECLGLSKQNTIEYLEFLKGRNSN